MTRKLLLYLALALEAIYIILVIICLVLGIELTFFEGLLAAIAVKDLSGIYPD